MLRTKILGWIGLFSLAFTSVSHAQPTFNFNVTSFTAGGGVTTSNQLVQLFQDGATLWTDHLTDNVTLNIDLQYLPGQFLAGTSSSTFVIAYGTTTTALANDATSVDDFSSVANLQPGLPGLVINRTLENGGSATPYFDNNGSINNSFVQLNDANAMAMGLADPNPAGPDATIIIGNAPGGLVWDTNRANGIGGASFDLVGVAAHELGHAMGFRSAVDFLDSNPGIPENSVFQTALDLFRFSDLSVGFGTGVFDLSADTRDKYFSVDGGVSNLGLFSEGITFGDGRQASHWKDNNLGFPLLGIMDPTLVNGQLVSVSELDLRAMDVIGWSRIVIPEPSSVWLVAAGVAAFVYARRRRRYRSAPAG